MMQSKPDLRIIRGGRDKGIQIGAVHVTPASRSHPPFPITIQVHAEDTWRILSADIGLKETSEHPIRISTDLIEDRPEVPGSILIQGTRWLAIVYDLDQQPICRDEWISQALEKLLLMAAERSIPSLRLPLLGTEHGDLPWQRSLELICKALHDVGKGPERIWLMANRQQINEGWELLQHYSDQETHK
jgi:hypothetical protein